MGTGGAGGSMGTGGSGTGGMSADPNCPTEIDGSSPPALKLTQVVTGLNGPLLAIGAPDDETRLYVVEKNGRIRIVNLTTNQLEAEPFLDITAKTTKGGEQGLLGLAFHPNYKQNGRFFVNYTGQGGGPDGQTVIAEYQRSADPNKADTNEKVILTVNQPYSNHNGGMVAFGKDGFLYIGMGDGGSGGDPQNYAQNLQSQLGKMLRIDVDAYPTPVAGNLPVMNGSNPHIWSYGLRNPWRFSFDRCNGSLYIADVGQFTWEEIDAVPANSPPQNFGWRVMEGTHCYDPINNCDMAGKTMPIAEYQHTADMGNIKGECSVSGGFVYRGKAIAGLVGWYLYGDYCSGRVWALRWRNDKVEAQVDITDDLQTKPLFQGGIAAFGQDTAGELYMPHIGNGTLYRIDAE